jgi:hypothetical protein
MVWDWMTFLDMILIVFGLVMAITGLFSAYFGSGKSRTVGVVLTILGIIIFVGWVYLCTCSGIAPFYLPGGDLWTVVWNALVPLVAVLIGALIAVGIFLVSVMKS